MPIGAAAPTYGAAEDVKRLAEASRAAQDVKDSSHEYAESRLGGPTHGAK